METTKVRFAPEAAKREMTPVDNLFFTEYMPDADGMFVKVYLYGLMQCYHMSLADESIAERLGITDAEVRCAFVYWQAKGLVRIAADNPLTVEYRLTDAPSLTGAAPVKYRPFVAALNALTAPRQFDMRELRAMYDCIELYGLEEATVLELVAYCMEQKGKRVSSNYILATAQTWNEAHIVTPEQAKAYLDDYRVKKHGASEVLLRWSKRRRPSSDEMDLYDKWINEWGFDKEAILAVCAELVNIGTPTFGALDRRLAEKKEKNLTDVAAIEANNAAEADEYAFSKAVFERIGRIEPPGPTEAAQIAMFRKALTDEVVWMAADACRDAERPFGVLKKLLIEWMGRKICTVEQAKEALAARQAARPAQRSRKKNHSSEAYEQHTVRLEDLQDIIVDLNEDLDDPTEAEDKP